MAGSVQRPPPTMPAAAGTRSLPSFMPMWPKAADSEQGHLSVRPHAVAKEAGEGLCGGVEKLFGLEFV